MVGLQAMKKGLEQHFNNVQQKDGTLIVRHNFLKENSEDDVEIRVKYLGDGGFEFKVIILLENNKLDKIIDKIISKIPNFSIESYYITYSAPIQYFIPEMYNQIADRISNLMTHFAMEYQNLILLATSFHTIQKEMGDVEIKSIKLPEDAKN